MHNQPPYVTIGISPQLQIRGVIALRDIAVGTCMESCPIIMLPEKEIVLLDETIVANYKYGWGETSECIVLGYGSLYNHSYTPNTIYKRDFERKVFNYIALRDIAAGEELLINYNGDPLDQTPIADAYLS
jgi:SET domain-containing protein